MSWVETQELYVGINPYVIFEGILDTEDGHSYVTVFQIEADIFCLTESFRNGSFIEASVSRLRN